MLQEVVPIQPEPRGQFSGGADSGALSGPPRHRTSNVASLARGSAALVRHQGTEQHLDTWINRAPRRMPRIRGFAAGLDHRNTPRQLSAPASPAKPDGDAWRCPRIMTGWTPDQRSL